MKTIQKVFRKLKKKKERIRTLEIWVEALIDIYQRDLSHFESDEERMNFLLYGLREEMTLIYKRNRAREMEKILLHQNNLTG